MLRIIGKDRKAATIRVDESSDQRGRGEIGPCKNATAYRVVLLRDREGQGALQELSHFLKGTTQPEDLLFRSRRGKPLLESTILNQGLYPALRALGFKKAGMHAFRRGCNRRWELAGINPAVIRQQMGHTSAAMTRLYTGEIPFELVEAEFSSKNGNKFVVLEKMENEAAA